MSWRARILAVLGAFALIGWLAGLVAFVRAVESFAHAPAGVHTDAIVVLTGGSERIAAGIGLLEQGRGRKLLISGVPPGLTLDRLPGRAQVPKRLRDCCIVLGHAAESTFGNAEETRDWMEREKFRSLQLVTADYHMPRSLMIFRAALPQAAIIPCPVAPESVMLNEWWRRPGTASLLVTEYNKYLWAALRLGLDSTWR